MKRWIDEDMEEVPPLSQMADQLGYSYFYVAKKFHEIEGVSLRAYIANRKIQMAAVDLYTTQQRTIDIAVRYGYSSQEAFSRAFVKVFGISPVLYRRMQKPTSSAEKSALLGLSSPVRPTKTRGGTPMKLYVKQMYDWNCYAYYAEDVDEKYWEYFKSELWWQLGNSFIKQFDNVADFEYCAKNFEKYGETAIKQALKMIPAPWERALDLFATEMQSLGVDWYVHGSTAMALWGIDVPPRDVNIIIANYSDFDTVRERFYKLAIHPIERCDNWLMSGLGTIFMEANIGLAFHNKELEPYDMSRLTKLTHNGHEVWVESLEALRRDNENYGRPERVALIEKRMAQST
jgi:AraC-like DNA-binding protein